MGIYTEILKNSITGIYRTNAANKILQFINRIRNESDINQARRFLIELMQNARDLAYKTPEGNLVPVSIRIRLSDTELEFSHNGKVFSVKDILSIIYQVSSKKPGEGIGQFGTGFMSTYQLSEVIELSSYLKDGENPYLPFSICLDRRGCDKEEILDGIERTMQQLVEADQAEEILASNFDLSAYNTSFLYHLNEERSREIARIGMEDLDHTILYTLLFSPQIKKIELIYETSFRKERIVYTNGKPIQLELGLQSITFSQGDQSRTLLYETVGEGTEQITVACEAKGTTLVPIGAQTPRIYIDFPLIGSETFPFPVVVNCRALHPNEPRSGISLVDNPNSLDARCNKEIMKAAVQLYGQFLHQLVLQGFEGFEHVIAMPVYQENKEWSTQWVRSKLYHDCLKRISSEPIFPTKDGRKCLNQVELRVVRAAQDLQRQAVQKLVEPLNGILVPVDDTDWDRALIGYELEESKWIDLERILKVAERIVKERLDTEKQDVISWVGQLYCCAMEDPMFADAVMASKYAVFLDQESVRTSSWSLKYFHEVKRDPDIPECLKDASMYLDCLFNQEDRLEIRSNLLYRDFPIQQGKSPELYEVERLIAHLGNHAELRCQLGYDMDQFRADRNRFWQLMIACGPDETMKNLAEIFWKTEIKQLAEPINDARFMTSMWTSTYRSVLLVIFTWIKNRTCLENLCSNLEQEEAVAIDWLNDVYASAAEYLQLQRSKEVSIMLNQAGKFCAASFLLEDRMDEELRQIDSVLHKKLRKLWDLQDILVDKRICLKRWDMKVMEDRDAAFEINQAVQYLLSEQSLSLAEEPYQDACSRLLGWIGDHEKEAGTLFPSFSKEEDRMKLLTTKAAVQLNRRAKELETLLSKHGVESLEELEAMIQASQEEPVEEMLSYDEENDVEFGADPFLLGLSRADLEQRLRLIGQVGEQYANKLLIQQFVERGYQIQGEKEHFCRLVEKHTGRIVEVYRPDSSDYHQPGWDIAVRRTKGTEGEPSFEEQTDYYEVKTCTKNSVRRTILQISNEQMIKAAMEGARYHLIRVICDSSSLEVVGSFCYDNLMQQLGNRTLRNLESGYIWQETGKFPVNG